MNYLFMFVGDFIIFISNLLYLPVLLVYSIGETLVNYGISLGNNNNEDNENEE